MAGNDNIEIDSTDPDGMLRHLLGIGAAGEEGHVVHDRDAGTLRIVNFGNEVWRSDLRIPKVRNHQTLVAMLVQAGFQTQSFRREFARTFFEPHGHRLPTKPCTATSCSCSAAMLDDHFADYEPEDGPRCVWQDVLSMEGYSETFRMIPDAWMVLPEHRLLVVAEVDITHHPAAERYVDVWWWLDNESWSLCVLHIDRHGNACAPYDMAALYFARDRDYLGINEGAEETIDEEPAPRVAPAVASPAPPRNDNAKPAAPMFMWRGKARPL